MNESMKREMADVETLSKIVIRKLQNEFRLAFYDLRVISRVFTSHI